MKGKYQRRKRARVERENGGTATILRDKKKRGVNVISVRVDVKFEAAVAEARKLKRAKKRGCSNVDRNMEALGYRRVSGDEMVIEQFEVIA